MKKKSLNLQGWDRDAELQEEERREVPVMEGYTNSRGPRQVVKL